MGLSPCRANLRYYGAHSPKTESDTRLASFPIAITRISSCAKILPKRQSIRITSPCMDELLKACLMKRTPRAFPNSIRDPSHSSMRAHNFEMPIHFVPMLVTAMTLPRTVYLCYPGGIISPAPPAPAKAMSKVELFGCAEPQSVRIQRDLTDRWRPQYEQRRYSFASTTVYHRRAPATSMNQVPSRTRESGDYILDGVLECILGATSEDAIQVSLSMPHSRGARRAGAAPS